MKTRIFWVPILVLIVVAIGVYFYRQGALPLVKPVTKPARSTGTVVIEPPPPAFPVVVAAPPVITPKPIALPPPPQQLAPELVLPIQDQATIDFSIGSPVIKRDGSDAEALKKALKEIEEATRNLTIPSVKPEPAKN